MQDDQYASYRVYLRDGMRIEVGIPLSGGGVFRDWAVVHELVEDELSVQISRDILPTEVHIEEGDILDVTVSVRNEAYTCSGIVTGKSGRKELRIRLFGQFMLRERRQFFRISLNLRVRAAQLPDGRLEDNERDWEQRRDAEHMKFQGYDQPAIAAYLSKYQPSVTLEWHDMLYTELSLSGGGICVNLPERLQPEQLVALEIHLPLDPPRLVQGVGQVIHVIPKEQKKDGPQFATGLKFVLLDERDRDLLFRQISSAQIEYLRNLADRRDFRQDRHDAPGEGVGWRRVAARSLWALVSIALVYCLARYLVQYSERGAPGQIEKTYEQSLRKYRHMD